MRAGALASRAGVGTAGRASLGAIWAVALLIAAWVILRILPYADRARVYRAVASALEAFVHPATLVVLAAIALALVATRRRSRGAETLAPGESTQDVHLRAEPPGHVSVVFSDGRGGLERDFVFDRRVSEEERILAGFDALASRMAAFTPAGSGPGRFRASKAEIDEARREIRALGLAIRESLLGGSQEVVGRLQELPGDHLLLRITPDLARIPWELLVTGERGRFLWQLFHVSRQIRDETAAPSPARAPGGPLRLLLLANPEAGERGRDLPAAEAEAAEVLELSSRAPDRLLVVRKSPTSASELRTLVSRGFSVVHFAGHAEADATGQPGWVLAGGETAALSDLFEGAAPPLLVFANSCGTGRSATRTAEGLSDAARAVLRQGVGAYLGTLWRLHDDGSAAFASSFYRALVAGETLGAAVSGAREALLGTHPFTWANYVLYGDPALRALDPRRLAKSAPASRD